MSDSPACPTPSSPTAEPASGHQLVLPKVPEPPKVFPHCVSAYRRTIAQRLRESKGTIAPTPSKPCPT